MSPIHTASPAHRLCVIRFDGSDRIGDFLERFPMCESVMSDLSIPADDGEAQVGEAITEAGLPLPIALAHLASMATMNQEYHEDDWSSFALDELAEHIESNHHSFTRYSLARLDAIIGVLKLDAQQPHPLRDAFIPFKHALICHLEEEEKTLFPQCRQLEHDTRAWLRDNKDLRRCTSAINTDHDHFAEAIENLLELSRAEPWPSEFTEYQQAFAQGLEALAADLTIHAHLEYEYLIPSALHMAKLERSRVESQIQRQTRKEQAELG